MSGRYASSGGKPSSVRMSVMVGTYFAPRSSAPSKKPRRSVWKTATLVATSGLSRSNSGCGLMLATGRAAAAAALCAPAGAATDRLGAALVIACFTLGPAWKQPLTRTATLTNAIRAAGPARRPEPPSPIVHPLDSGRLPAPGTRAERPEVVKPRVRGVRLPARTRSQRLRDVSAVRLIVRSRNAVPPTAQPAANGQTERKTGRAYTRKAAEWKEKNPSVGCNARPSRPASLDG